MEVVLVHGTTQSPRGWELLVLALTDRGHTCHAVDLGTTPSGQSSSAFARTVAEQVVVTSPIVVAHSGAGLLLGAISQALDAKNQVFLGAVIPDGRRSLMSEIQQHAAEIFYLDWLGKDPVGDVGVARRFLFHDCDESTADWACTTLRLFFPESVYNEVVPLDLATPATVIVPRSDRTIRASWMERAADDRLGVSAIIVDGGHCPHVSRPVQVAEIIDAIGNT